MKVSIAQWIGKRAKQEDAYAVRHFPNASLAVVCDGMGGHDCGKHAAETAAQAFVEAFAQAQDAPMTDRLRGALNQANDAVGSLFAKLGSYGGCTLLAVCVGAGCMWWISVGDSRLFVWRRGRLLHLNADHSMRALYEEFVRTGAMNYREAMAQGHSLRSAVTGEVIPMVDAPPTPYPLLPGDRIILASDGVDDLLLPPPLPPAVRHALDSREDELPSAIVEHCRRLDSPTADNVTVLGLDWMI